MLPMVTEDEAREALGKVIHPSFGMSLLALDTVRAIRINGSKLEVDLVMNCPGCPGAEIALAAARKALYALEGVDSVKLVLVPEIWVPPWERQY
jgi:metal-sulfur cluster biosynthetic enzyme